MQNNGYKMIKNDYSPGFFNKHFIKDMKIVGPGDFTDTGHFLLVTGVENGMYRVHDPNSPTNTAQLWTYDRLVSQIRGAWLLWSE